MSLVLAIEPEHRQATILKRIVREQVRAELVLVDSRDAAIAAIAARVPDIILVTALLSPRDEEELQNYLRTLEGAEHLQTYTIPQLAASVEDTDQRGGGGLFGFLRKKETEPVIGGCEPDLFAQEIRTYLDRAAERRSEAAAAAKRGDVRRDVKVRQAATPAQPMGQAPGGAGDADAQPASTASAWSSPFEWRPVDRTAPPAPPPAPAPDPAPPSAGFEAQATAPAPSVEDDDAAPPLSLVTNVPLAVLAEDQEDQAKRSREQELARLAAEADERRRLEAAAREREAEEERRQLEERRRQIEEERRQIEEERRRLEAEAAAQRQRELEERQRREEEERLRLEAEAALRREREEAERRRREEEERKRLEAEAAARRKREEEERRRRELEERKRLEAEAAARRKREEEERRRREQEERKRLEAEAAVRRKREEEERKRRELERKRLEAELAARKKREEDERKRRELEERKRLEAEAAARKKREEEERKRREEEERRRRDDEERRRTEAEAAARKKREEEKAARERQESERKRLELEAAARKREEEERRRREDEEERQRQGAKQVEAAARKREEEERQRREEEERAAQKRAAEEALQQERARKQDERRRQAEERRRQEDEDARRRDEEKARQHEERRRQHEIAAVASDDPFAEFRAEHDEPTGILRLMPLSDWARVDRRAQPVDQDVAQQDELSRFFSGLSVPPQVAVISYPRGCRIRRVRVRALEQPPPPRTEGKKPLIVSRRALRQSGTGSARAADR